MPTYVEAASTLAPYVARVMGSHHHGLRDAEVTIGCLFAHAKRDKNGDPKGPALKHAGYQAAAVIRIVNHRDRVAGMPDAMLIVDGDKWDEWSERRREALIHHELTHLELADDGDGGVIRDDCGRPKLAMRLHDVQLGVFMDVIERYGSDAIDSEVCRDLHRQLVQREFEFDDVEADGESENQPGKPLSLSGDNKPFVGEVAEFLRESGVEFEMVASEVAG